MFDSGARHFLQVDRLCKTFPGGVPVLRECALSVREHECLVLFGPSGCGKTTTLRLIAGLETPTSGEIFIQGKNVGTVPPWRRGVAFAFQQAAVMPHRTVRRQLEDQGPDKREMAALADTLQMTNLMERRGWQLSGGERQRVALARVLLSRQPLLLMDEPLAHLDVPVKRKLWRELVLLRGRFPATIVYVTHDPAEALALGDRVAVLLNGVMVQADAPARLQASPAHEFIAEAFKDWSRDDQKQ